MSFFFERPQSTLGLSAARGQASLEDIFAASVEQMRLVDNTNAAEAALREAYDARIRAIEETTGERLANPMLDFSADQWIPGMQLARPILGAEAGRGDAIGDFDRQLSELAARYPEVADVIGADRPIREDALALARGADEDLERLFESREGFDRWMASLAGGMAGSFSDPWTIASLGIGAGPAAGRTVASRILSVATREAAINAGVEAAMQPVIQNWRAEAGLDHGLGQALANIGLAAALGGVFGGALAGAGEGVSAALRRRLTPAERDAVAAQAAGDARVSPEMRDALAGDPAAAARVLNPIRETLPPAARGALDQAEVERAVVAPARAQALEAETQAIAARSLPPAERPPVLDEASADFASLGPEGQRVEANWRQASLLDRVDEIEARLAAGEGAEDIARDLVRREGGAAAMVPAARQMVEDVQAKLGVPDPRAGEAFAAWRDDFLARQDVRDRLKEVPTPEREAVLEPTIRAEHVRASEASARAEATLETATRAAAGDERAMAEVMSRDPETAGLADRARAPARAPERISEGFDDPFDEAALMRSIDEFELDEATLAMSVDDGDGNMVPLADLLARADEELAMSRMVSLCRI